MSEMEYNSGTLTLVSSDAESFANNFVRDKGIEIPDCYDSALEYFEEGAYDNNFVVINGKVYSVVFDVRRGDESDMGSVLLWQQEDPVTFKFATYHYNGGAHWTEIVAEELEKV